MDIPGSGHFLIYSWVFVFLYNVGPSGHGDSRAFHNAFGAICILFGLSLLAFVATPAMASYGVMNLIMFVWLFVCGLLTANLSSMPTSYLIAAFSLIGLVGLNAQKPVRFMQVEALFFGLALPLVLAVLVQRLVPPSLPQWEFRDRLQEFLSLINHKLRSETPREAGWDKAGEEMREGRMRTYCPNRNSSPTQSQPASRMSQQMACDLCELSLYRDLIENGDQP